MTEISATTKKHTRREFRRYLIPAVIGMVVSSLYNIIDGIFVGRGVGETALGAINIVFPFIMLEIAITMLIGIGGASQFSIARGRGDNETANHYFLQSFTLLVGIGIILNTVVLLFTPQVCLLLGADSELLPYAIDYIRWIAVFGILYMPGLGLSVFVRNDNAPQTELAGTLVGTVVNIVLDYLFIMKFNMGIGGAALATGIAQAISVGIFFTHFLSKKRILHFAKIRWSKADLRKILITGIPTFLMEFSQATVAFSFNLILMARIGAIAVSYYSIVMYICSISNMILIGITQGAQPVMSYRHGVGNDTIVSYIKSLASRTALISTVVIYIVVFFAGGSLAAIFVPDNPALTGLAANMMKYYFLAFFPIGVTLIDILFFQITERSWQSILLSFLRCIGFIQLFLLVLPVAFGTVGIYLSFLCGELCHYLLARVFTKKAGEKQLLLEIKLANKQ